MDTTLVRDISYSLPPSLLLADSYYGSAISFPSPRSCCATELIRDIKSAVSIPVIASSGAGKVEHFSEVLTQARPDAVLAAGIFHRQEVPISAVKARLKASGFAVRE